MERKEKRGEEWALVLMGESLGRVMQSPRLCLIYKVGEKYSKVGWLDRRSKKGGWLGGANSRLILLCLTGQIYFRLQTEIPKKIGDALPSPRRSDSPYNTCACFFGT